jgi:peptide/nickel transport system substrate-binding protein
MGILPEDHVWYNPDQPEIWLRSGKSRSMLDEQDGPIQTGMEYAIKTGKNCHMYCPSAAAKSVLENHKERLSEVGIDVR